MTELTATFQRPRIDEPLVVLTYPYSGVVRLRELLVGLPGFAWAGTDLVASCGLLAANWQEIDGHGEAFSQIAQASIKSLFNTMITTRLVSEGAVRLCTPASSSPRATKQFALVYPKARFLCLHRRPLDVIYAAVAANPWGLSRSPCAQFAMRYPGNSVAAGAEYWAQQTDEMLAFELAHAERVMRIQYEKLAADSAAASRAIQAFIGTTIDTTHIEMPFGAAQPSWPEADADGMPSPMAVGCGANVPVELIPFGLLQKVNGLLSDLGYDPLVKPAEVRRPT